MADDLGPFFRQVANEVEDELNRVIKLMALAIDQAVVLSTPVDTGRARSNWLVSVDTPFVGVIDAYSPGEGLGIGESANASRALSQGRGAIAVRQPGQSIFIQNNVAYIGALNDGTSAQAPRMFVETAIMEGLAQLNNFRL